MERRFAARMQEALEGAVVDPRMFRDVQPRLENFLEPFVGRLQEVEQKAHARSYVTGLLSDLKRKTVESIAYLHDQERLPLQTFIGQIPVGPPTASEGIGPPSRCGNRRSRRRDCF